MKKALFILSSILVFSILSSCTTVDNAVESATVKKNWIFTITMVTTYTPTSATMPPLTLITTQEQDNLTEVEAEAARLTLVQQSPTLTQTSGTMTQTMTFTITKAVKP